MKTSIPDIIDIIDKYGNDPSRLMDILLDIQEEIGYIPEEFNQKIAETFQGRTGRDDQFLSFLQQ